MAAEPAGRGMSGFPNARLSLRFSGLIATLRQSALPSDSEAAPSCAAFSSTACFTVRARACFFFFLMRRVLPVRALRWSRGGASSSKRSLSCAREFARTVSRVSTSAGASDTIAVTQSGTAQPNRANICTSLLGSPLQ